jgi:hypothetical protein
MWVTFVSHLSANPRITTFIVTFGCDCLPYLPDQLITVSEIPHNLITWSERENLLLQARKQQVLTESDTYQDPIAALPIALNYANANTEALHAAATETAAAWGEQHHPQPVSITNPDLFDCRKDKLCSLVYYLHM